MPKADKAGFPTYWTTFGMGPRAALAIHCSLAHSGSWGPLARHVSGLLTVTAFDLPGHGRSGAWDGRGEIQGVSAAIAADFPDGPVDVIGHSFGATVALRLAVERPELVRSLVLIEPVFFAVAAQDDPVALQAYLDRMAGYAAALEAGDAWATAREFTTVWGDGTPWDKMPDAQRKALADGVHIVEAATPALMDDVGGMLDPGRLERLTQSVLLIEGSRSPAIISVINAGLAARLTGATRAVILGARHMAPITHAAQVGAEVLRFLR